MAGEVVLIDPFTGDSYKAGSASGPQPASSSQSVTPASDTAPFPVYQAPSSATAGIVSTTAAPNTAVVQANRATGTTYQLFPAVATAFRERYIVNPNLSGSIWATFHDAVTPAANGEGSFEIPPGGAWTGSVSNQVRAIFTANTMAITHGAR